MNFNCIICSDLFNPSSEIFVTRCGHAFHYTCLIQWIERSKTCPQCRDRANEKSIFRMYFNIVTLEGIEDDAVTLQSKLDNANLQLRLQESSIKSTEEKLSTILDEKHMIQEKFKDLKAEYETIKSGFSSLKEKLKFYKDRAKLVDKVEAEIQDLKKSMESKEQAIRAITGSIEDAYEVINATADPKTLAMIVSSLKKEIQLTEKKKNKYFSSMKRAENELNKCKKELDASNSELENLKRDLAAHTQCEEQIQALKKHLSEIMENSKAVNPALARIVAESPAPLRTTRLLEDNSPSIVDRVKQIKESDSPYLKVKSSSMGLLLKSQESSCRFASNNSSIFKNTSSSNDIIIKKPLPEYNYDGLGGHSKDERFPVPVTKGGIKRTKSSMSSRKFRKLAKPNKKIDDFLDISSLD